MFLRSTKVGPYPGEMQAAWDVLRDEAASNYGLEEGWREEAARDRMGPLAEKTPAEVRNRGAAERKRGREGGTMMPAAGPQLVRPFKMSNKQKKKLIKKIMRLHKKI